MRTRLITSLLVIFALSLSGCQFFEKTFKKNKSADTLAVWEAKQDSIRKAEEAAKVKQAELERLEREKFIQDSLMQVKELEERNRFHVIIGSFKVPSNATLWQDQVQDMGYGNTRILQSLNGFDMVSIASYDTYSKAFNEILRIQNQQGDEPVELWVYERR